MAESNKPGIPDDAEYQTLNAAGKPALDEETFQQLLEAAHVLQELKNAETVTRPKADPAAALAEIVATQDLLRSQPCDLNATANLIVERLRKITSASGVAVGLVREDQLEYCAATGDAARLEGSRLAMDAIVSADGGLSTEFSRAHAGKNSIALSLLHDGKLAGLLEVRFADTDSIPEPEMRSCQLMAGLMTEAIARSADQEWRQTLAAERAAMLEALERIKPQLERLAVTPAAPAVEAVPRAAEASATFPQAARESVQSQSNTARTKPTSAEPVTTSPPISELSARSRVDAICPQCGYQFGEQELFCGRCGTARPAGTLPSGDLQSKWASMWHMQQEEENRRLQTEKNNEETKPDPSPIPSSTNPGGLFSPRLSSEVSSELSPELEKMRLQFSQEAEQAEPAIENDTALSVNPEVENTAAVPVGFAEQQESPSPWGSAKNAQQWLESLDSKSPAGIWLRKHRADIYVGAAVILLLLAWGMHSPENHVQAKSPPQPSLTLFEKLMVSLGLAETPTVPVYLGNPNAQVWVDLHTALYYCSDSELYGKTPGGKFTNQRDAQMDQFEPAARKNCE